MSRRPNPADAFGVEIRQARIERGWTQAELASHAQVSRPTVARIETGADVSTATLVRVAETLGLQIQLQRPAN